MLIVASGRQVVMCIFCFRASSWFFLPVCFSTLALLYFDYHFTLPYSIFGESCDVRAFKKQNQYQNFLLLSFANVKVKPHVFEPGPVAIVISGIVHKYS